MRTDSGERTRSWLLAARRPCLDSASRRARAAEGWPTGGRRRDPEAANERLVAGWRASELRLGLGSGRCRACGAGREALPELTGGRTGALRLRSAAAELARGLPPVESARRRANAASRPLVFRFALLAIVVSVNCVCDSGACKYGLG
ncbi:hypothetical protein [Rhabdochromatium marinum]|uniref:hypothetical protein n=1 Tax=Rhabdochromatium marinum TaxID=48729 RepID=UPI001F5BB9FE|nr:hypothetical protein [Rhabdochromatium marinum]